MASIGHLGVGLAAARVQRESQASSWRSIALWSALSMLPDADVIGLSMGVPYGAAWGHRGATHSFAFSLAVGTIVGMVSPKFRLPALRTGALATLVLASHGVLDTLTDGGLGVSLLWPFDLTRYFAPWRPIAVSPIGLDYFSSYGLMVASLELALFAPVFLFAITPAARAPSRSMTAAFLTVWCVVVWLIASTDSFRERAVGALLREDTVFANGFSEARFRAVEPGQSETNVRRALGAPLGEFWYYGSSNQPAFEISAAELEPGCLSVGFRDGVVWWSHVPELCRDRGVDVGARTAEVVRLLGTPSDVCLQYGKSPSGGYHRVRDVCFFHGTVSQVFRRWARSAN